MSEVKFELGTDYTLTDQYRLRGRIVHGFKRGSTQLGFPTANVDPSAFAAPLKDAKHGVYFGWAQVLPYGTKIDPSCPTSPTTTKTTEQPQTDSETSCEEIERLHYQDYGVFKCMLSLGKNVQFDATNDTLEAYVHHTFQNNFYDHQIEIIICGYIRPQLTFESLEALISAIKRDVEIGDEGLVVNDELKKLEFDDFFTKVIKVQDGTILTQPGSPAMQ